MASYTNDPKKKGQAGWVYVGDAASDQSSYGVATEGSLTYPGDNESEGYYGQTKPVAPSMSGPEFSSYLDQRYGAAAPAAAATTQIARPASYGGGTYDFSAYPVDTGEASASQATPRGSITTTGQPLSVTNPWQMVQTGGITTTTSRAVAPTTPRPSFPDIPTLTLPAWDKKAVAAIAQRLSAPSVARLRQEVQRAAMQPYDNPNVRAQALRQALSGYGLGLGDVMAKAETAAMAEYGPEHAQDVAQAQINWQAEVKELEGQWQATWDEYMKGWGTETTVVSKPTYEFVKAPLYDANTGKYGQPQTMSLSM